jgi:acyl-CoA synthetase (NDP forming)
MPDLNAFLSPNAVAVIGAANNPEILRGRIMKVMMGHDFKGDIFPISRSSDEVMGLKAYPTISDVPGHVDLAILIIPAEFVPDTLRECGKKGVKAAQIITSGFAEEIGGDGTRQQAKIREIAEEFDMAICGPNSEGFANTQAALCPTFSPAVDENDGPLMPDYRKNGHITAIAQSGGVGFSFFDRGRPKELPFNYILTTGNEAALEELDFVDHLLDTGETDIFLLFMEDIKTPEKLAKVGEKALRAGKPIIVTKVGRSDAGQRAAASHTAALAGAYSGYQAMFQRYGIIEGDDIEEMVDIASGFSHWSHMLPAGKRIGITTGSGGAGGLMADTAALAGLEVPILDPEARARIDEHLPNYGTSQNPVDGTAQAVREVGYARLNRMVMDAKNVDAVIGICSARHNSTFIRERDDLTALKANADKPVVLCSYTLPREGSTEIVNRCGLPLYTNMRNCARSLVEMADYRALRERFLKRPNISTANVPNTDTGAKLAAGGKILCEYEAKPLLAAHGVLEADERLATTGEEALEIAEAIGGKVALKVQSPDILHKTEAGAVALNILGGAEARKAFEYLTVNARAFSPGADIRGVLIQPMANKGQEVILGINRDPSFGPMLMVGMGGVFVEIMKDVAFAPVPLTADDAHTLLNKLKGRKLLDGVRGEPPADVAALVELMVNLSHFAANFADEIQEIDLNPVLVHPKGDGVTVVDALIVKQGD